VHIAYRIVLAACAVAAAGLVARRLLELSRHQHARPTPGRLMNEWTWTLIPLAVLAALLWVALK